MSRHSYVRLSDPVSYHISYTNEEQTIKSRQPFIAPSTPTFDLDVEDTLSCHSPQPDTKPFIKQIWSGWQRGVALACVCTAITLLINVYVYIWATTRPMSERRTYILMSSDQETTKRTEIWIHLAINILSMMILSGSNYTLQVLQSPTRLALNSAHSKNISLAIGTWSIKNGTYMCWQRRTLYALMVILMIPLHLIYNSVISSTLATNDLSNSRALVTQDFLQLQPNDESPYKDIWSSMQYNTTHLDNNTCITILTSGPTSSPYTFVLLVANISGEIQNDTWYYSTPETLPNFTAPNTWLVSNENVSLPTKFGGSWTLSVPVAIGDKTESIPAYVESCLAQTNMVENTIELIPELLLIIIICNTIKFGCLIAVLTTSKEPLVTIGDAVASFLDEPLEIHGRHPPDTASKVNRQEYRPRWKVRRRQWFDNVSTLRWRLTLLLCFGFWLALIILCGLFNSTWSSGDPASFGLSLISTTLIANTPQVVLSIIYVYYNALFTTMLAASEFNTYTWHQKGLRVSKPQGDQRSTYFLSVPYKYSIPLASGLMLLHWLLSQSFYIVQTNMFAHGNPDHSGDVHGLMLGLAPMVAVLVIAPIMWLIPPFFGLRWFRPGLPFKITESIPLGIACYGDHNEGHLSIQKIRYGVIRRLPSGRHLVGFSKRKVAALERGQVYQ